MSDPKPFAFTATSLTDFEGCPRKHNETRLAKRFPDTGDRTAADFGDGLHKALERYCKGQGEFEIDPKFKDYKEIGDKVLALPGRKFYELQLAINGDLDPVDYWSKPAPFYRCKIDVFDIVNQELALAIDYKSGKVKSDPTQLDLNALTAFAHYPKIQLIGTAYWWLTNGGTTTSSKIYRYNTPDLWNKYLPRAHAYKEAIEKQDFPPRPSGLCHGWCPVTTCEFHKPPKNKGY